MTTHIIILGAILASIALVLTILLLLPPKERRERPSHDGDGNVAVSAAGGIVTVRKVGRVTSVYIREGIRDHWDVPGGIALPMIPPDVTKANEPELYAEYMSPGTSAARKYEIIDELYSMGFTLPFIRGLNEQYKKELQEALSSGEPDARAANERTPINLTPQ